MEKKGKKTCKKSGSASSAPATTNKTFRALTKGYEGVFFTSGTAKDAAQFMDMIEQLSRYVATLGWNQASALAKVMTDLKDPTLVAPVRPTRTYLSGSGPDTVKTTDRITLGVMNIQMVDDIDYQATMNEYLRKKRSYDSHMENWDENNAKGYYLVLQHCPKDLKVELRNQDSWKAAEDARSIVATLLLIRDWWSNSRATAERQRRDSGATAERQRSNSGATAERQRSDSGATAERQRSDSGATALHR